MKNDGSATDRSYDGANLVDIETSKINKNTLKQARAYKRQATGQPFTYWQPPPATTQSSNPWMIMHDRYQGSIRDPYGLPPKQPSIGISIPLN